MLTWKSSKLTRKMWGIKLKKSTLSRRKLKPQRRNLKKFSLNNSWRMILKKRKLIWKSSKPTTRLSRKLSKYKKQSRNPGRTTLRPSRSLSRKSKL